MCAYAQQIKEKKKSVKLKIEKADNKLKCL